MGDAYECVEELLFLVRALSHSDSEVEEALRAFRRFKRGELVPVEPCGVPSDDRDVDRYSVAYLETQRVMNG